MRVLWQLLQGGLPLFGAWTDPQPPPLPALTPVGHGACYMTLLYLSCLAREMEAAVFTLIELFSQLARNEVSTV